MVRPAMSVISRSWGAASSGGATASWAVSAPAASWVGTASAEAAGPALWAQPDNSIASGNSRARSNASPFLFLRIYRLHLFPCFGCRWVFVAWPGFIEQPSGRCPWGCRPCLPVLNDRKTEIDNWSGICHTIDILIKAIRFFKNIGYMRERITIFLFCQDKNLEEAAWRPSPERPPVQGAGIIV